MTRWLLLIAIATQGTRAVDIIPHATFRQARSEHRPLHVESRVMPILRKTHLFLCYAHDVDDPIAVRFWRKADHQVSYPCDTSYRRLAAGERAIAAEGVGRKSPVRLDDVGEQSHALCLRKMVPSAVSLEGLCVSLSSTAPSSAATPSLHFTDWRSKDTFGSAISFAPGGAWSALLPDRDVTGGGPGTAMSPQRCHEVGSLRGESRGNPSRRRTLN